MNDADGVEIPATYGANCSVVNVPAAELWQLLVSVSESLRYVAMGAAPSPTVTVCRCGEWHWASSTSVGRSVSRPEHDAPPTPPTHEGHSRESTGETEWTAVGKGASKEQRRPPDIEICRSTNRFAVLSDEDTSGDGGEGGAGDVLLDNAVPLLKKLVTNKNRRGKHSGALSEELCWATADTSTGVKKKVAAKNAISLRAREGEVDKDLDACSARLAPAALPDEGSRSSHLSCSALGAHAALPDEGSCGDVDEEMCSSKLAASRRARLGLDLEECKYQQACVSECKGDCDDSVAVSLLSMIIDRIRAIDDLLGLCDPDLAGCDWPPPWMTTPQAS
jgi:hypothetical protein